jgi:CheY-like chemotaxis protein
MLNAREQKSILIADDDVDLVDTLGIRAKIMGLEVIVAYDAMAALERAIARRPDVVCLDVNMPGGNGLSACELLAGDERFAKTPVIVLTGSRDEETIRRCHRLSAYYVEKCPNVWSRIEPLLNELLQRPKEAPEMKRPHEATSEPSAAFQPPARSSAATAGERLNDAQAADAADAASGDASDPPVELIDAVFAMLGAGDTDLSGKPAGTGETARNDRGRDAPPWVLSIDDDRDFSFAVKKRLEAHGVAVVRAFDGTQGYVTAFTHPADVILLDYEMPQGKGDYVLRRLKENPITSGIPVIVITGRRERSIERQMYGLGASSFMTKPVDMPALLEQLSNYIPVLPWRENRTAAAIG